MLNNMMKTTLAAAILASGLNAAFAESVDVKVIGTIILGACTPTLSGGGVVDYGYIKASTLSADDYTTLAQKTLDLTINCEATAKVAIRPVNGRPNTMAGVTEGSTQSGTAPVTLDGVNPIAGAGLGLDGTSKIGGYALRVTDFTADGVATSTIWVDNENGTGTWTEGYGDLYRENVERSTSWAKSGEVTPIAFKTLVGKLNVQAYINKSSELDLTHAIKLDGLTTLEVVYL